jgi:hypothetical protein
VSFTFGGRPAPNTTKTLRPPNRRTDVTPKEFLKACGWTKGSGPNYYLPEDHPHIHLGLGGSGHETGNVGDNATYANKKKAYQQLKGLISFLAISNGQRATNLIRDGGETKDIKNATNLLGEYAGGGDNAVLMRDELHYILEAFGF